MFYGFLIHFIIVACRNDKHFMVYNSRIFSWPVRKYCICGVRCAFFHLQFQLFMKRKDQNNKMLISLFLELHEKNKAKQNKTNRECFRTLKTKNGVHLSKKSFQNVNQSLAKKKLKQSQSVSNRIVDIQIFWMFINVLLYLPHIFVLAKKNTTAKYHYHVDEYFIILKCCS